MDNGKTIAMQLSTPGKSLAVRGKLPAVTYRAGYCQSVAAGGGGWKDSARHAGGK